MQPQKIVSHEEWLVARKAHLAEEKAFTRARDALSRKRRELPWEKVEKNYVFDGPNGKETLAGLFGKNSQLVVYHFMFGPDYEAGCPSCSSTADSFNDVLAHLKARDVTMICVSRAPLEKFACLSRADGLELQLGVQPRKRLQLRLRRIGRGGHDARPSRAAARGQ